MSQHDFNIANQGFPAFRSDLNNALTALASNSSGATPPSTTYANQFWYETDTNTLYFRNEDNDAWITLAVFDQTNDEWEVRTGVIQAVDSGGVVIKTDEGTARITVADNGNVTIANDLTVSGDLVVTGSLDKISEGNSSVEVVDTGTGSVRVTVDGTETARFDTFGRLGIGTDTPARQLDIYDDGTVGQAVLAITAQNTDPSRIMFADTDDNNIGILDYQHSDDSMRFIVNNAERMRIESTGQLRFDSGYGSVATAYGCRAWVSFNGTGTVAIREDGNVSSITDNGTGDYTVNFTTAMPDAKYSLVATSGTATSAGPTLFNSPHIDAPTTTAFRLETVALSGGALDRPYNNVAVFR